MSVHERYRKKLDNLRPDVRRTHLPKPLGEVLTEMGVVTAEQVTRALEIQQQENRGRLLGEILVEHGAVNPRTIVGLVRTQLGHAPEAKQSHASQGCADVGSAASATLGTRSGG